MGGGTETAEAVRAGREQEGRLGWEREEVRVRACSLQFWTKGQSCEMGSLRGRGQTAEAPSEVGGKGRNTVLRRKHTKPGLLVKSVGRTKDTPPMSEESCPPAHLLPLCSSRLRALGDGERHTSPQNLLLLKDTHPSSEPPSRWGRLSLQTVLCPTRLVARLSSLKRESF